VRILVTGSAGFIGFHIARRLLADGHEVQGVDGLTPYYDVDLKRRRHAILKSQAGFAEQILMLEDMESLTKAALAFRPNIIIHLAAQAGVRYSLENPRAYIDSNLVGTFNLLEVARMTAPSHLLLASTSSVYGGNPSTPFAETDRADYPLTLYAATKKAGEEMSHAYSHLWEIPTTAFRFFTVYGPWGRPDMALFKFAQGIAEETPIPIYNHGDLARDFTYVEDLAEAVIRLIDLPPKLGAPVGAGDTLSPAAPWRVVNIGRGHPIRLMDFVAEVEAAMGRKATLEFLPMQPGDMGETFANCDLLHDLTGYQPDTPLAVGVGAFCEWFKAYEGGEI
jgi:UDP-glucuronate 4-epimerase